MAVESFVQCINQAVPHEQQNIRIQALFFLVELYHDMEDIERMKQCLYQAVELIEHYFPENSQHTPQWKELITLYLKFINPQFALTFPEQYVLSLSPLLRVNIIAEYKTRIQECLEEVEGILKNREYPSSHMSIIEWLEDIFGPMRILIYSAEGNEVILRHRFSRDI
jgi:hypothetical protein